MKYITIIGHFGGNKDFLDGQTVKTKIVANELINKLGERRIKCIDTYLKSQRPFKLLIQTFAALVRRDKLIVLLSGNGMKFYFPLLHFFVRWWGVDVYHDVIGGNLDSYVKEIPKFKKYLNSFRVNWVETYQLKSKLELLGITNCVVMPNFKRLEIVDSKTLNNKYEAPYRFCTFSRVMKEKGIESAIRAIEEVNAEKGEEYCQLDIYGQIDERYKDRFDAVMNATSNSIKYLGLVPYNDSVKYLKKYYAMLFPTTWDGEGFPGTVIDSFSAGLPVVASDWNSNSEIITNGVNGIIYSPIDPSGLMDSILHIIKKKDDINSMRINCINEANKYQPETHINDIIKMVECE